MRAACRIPGGPEREPGEAATAADTSGLAGATASQNRRVRTAAGGQRRGAVLDRAAAPSGVRASTNHGRSPDQQVGQVWHYQRVAHKPSNLHLTVVGLGLGPWIRMLTWPPWPP